MNSQAQRDNNWTHLLDGGVPWKLRERCRGSYLVSGSDGFTKSVSSRSCNSRATGESLDAYRRHCRPAACERAVFWVRMRLSNEAVTSCKAMAMVMLRGAISPFAAAAARCRAICFNCPAVARKRRPVRGCALLFVRMQTCDCRIEGLLTFSTQSKHKF